MRLTQDQMKLIMDLNKGEEEDGFQVIVEGEWVSEGKYDFREIIFRHQEKFWSLGVSRSGSYHTEYEYDVYAGHHSGEVTEVVPVEKTIIEWRTVSEN